MGLGTWVEEEGRRGGAEIMAAQGLLPKTQQEGSHQILNFRYLLK
jgi:hypothetical protein